MTACRVTALPGDGLPRDSLRHDGLPRDTAAA
jgi:hypothetical protein